MLLTRNVLLALEMERKRPQDIEGELGGEVVKTPLGGCWRFPFSKSSASSYGINPENRLLAAAYSEGKVLPAYELERKRIFNGLDISCLTDDNVLMFDIETTGTSKNNCTFLLGVSWFDEGGPKIEFYLARDYCEEASVLWRFSELFKSYRYICGFNSKAFDISRIRERSGIYQIDFGGVCEERHIDLYHIAREAYKKRNQLPGFKQRDLEGSLFLHKREDDVSSRAIPGVYKEFVRSQDAGQIREILRHNLLDILGLVALYKHFFHLGGDSFYMR